MVRDVHNVRPGVRLIGPQEVVDRLYKRVDAPEAQWELLNIGFALTGGYWLMYTNEKAGIGVLGIKKGREVTHSLRYTMSEPITTSNVCLFNSLSAIPSASLAGP